MRQLCTADMRSPHVTGVHADVSRVRICTECVKSLQQAVIPKQEQRIVLTNFPNISFCCTLFVYAIAGPSTRPLLTGTQCVRAATYDRDDNAECTYLLEI